MSPQERERHAQTMDRLARQQRELAGRVRGDFAKAHHERLARDYQKLADLARKEGAGGERSA